MDGVCNGNKLAIMVGDACACCKEMNGRGKIPEYGRDRWWLVDGVCKH